MSERIPTQPPQSRPTTTASQGVPHEGQDLPGKQSVTEASLSQTGRALLDRYTPKILNEVIRNLKMMLTSRAGLMRDIAVQVEKQEGTGEPGEVKKSILDPKALQEQLSKAEGDSSKLTPFEKILLAHLVGGLTLGEEPLPDGKFKFAFKSDEAQQEFFLKNSPLAMEKKTPLTEIKAAIYRGLFNFKGQDGKSFAQMKGVPSQQLVQLQAEQAANGTLVSDLQLANGRTEKFTQLEIKNNQQLLRQLASLLPGVAITAPLLTELSRGGELSYLALSHKVVHPELMDQVAQKLGISVEDLKNQLGINGAERGDDRMPRSLDRSGTILSARAEQMASQALDLNWRGQATAPVKAGGPEPQSGGGGLLSGLLGLSRKKKGGGYDTELVPGFVPWYQLVWQKRDWKQKPKWFVMLTYFTFFSTLVLFAYFVFRFLLQE